MRRAVPLLAAIAPLVLTTGVDAVPVLPPLSASPNVELVWNVPGSYAGLVFKDHYAFATGWATGLTVFDISVPGRPTPVGGLPLPHFENEDVDLCGDTLLIANDRLSGDRVGLLYVVDISEPTAPVLAAPPLRLAGEGRGAGHIANFVTADCSRAWIDGGDDVEVIDLSDPTAPASLGSFRSWAATGPDPENPGAFVATHDTERDSSGVLWSTGGGGVAGYRLTANPLAPEVVTSSGVNGVNIDFDEETSEFNDFILHNSQRASDDVLLVTEEDYVDTDQEQPGSCNGQGKFETWQIGSAPGDMVPLGTWQTELNADDSKAPITANCSSHWFDHRSDGTVAVAWYEQGVRLLDVSDPADIRQVGYYLPADGSTWAAYWVPGAPDLVYTTDVYRGLDVLRVTTPAGGPASAPTVTAPILSQWFGPLGTASGVAGFTPSESFGWSCALPVG